VQSTVETALEIGGWLVIGARDMEAGAVSVRLHHGGPLGAKPKAEVIANILAAIRTRTDKDPQNAAP